MLSATYASSEGHHEILWGSYSLSICIWRTQRSESKVLPKAVQLLMSESATRQEFFLFLPPNSFAPVFSFPTITMKATSLFAMPTLPPRPVLRLLTPTQGFGYTIIPSLPWVNNFPYIRYFLLAHSHALRSFILEKKVLLWPYASSPSISLFTFSGRSLKNICSDSHSLVILLQTSFQ